MAEIKYLVWIWKRGFLGIYFKVPVVRTAHVDRQTAKRLGLGFSFADGMQVALVEAFRPR